MIVAEDHSGALRLIDRLRENVELRTGLDRHNMLSEAAQQRGLDCLKRFAQRLRNLHSTNYKAIATNTLRSAVNGPEFCRKAEKILGIPIDIVSGREEARLIYHGVFHHFAKKQQQRIVVDIGGGSTELIIGKEQTPMALESTSMGCISYTQRYFSDGNISIKAFRSAEIQACLELQPLYNQYTNLGWDISIGCSGTIKAIGRLMTEVGLTTKDKITAEGLKKLRNLFVEQRHIDQLQFKELSEARRNNIVGGLAILRAIFTTLKISEMHVSAAALREGVLYQILGKEQYESVRERSTRVLQKRFHIDQKHAERVNLTAQTLLTQITDIWNFDDNDLDTLRYAAMLHEIGLTLTHGKHHIHGHYLLKHADLYGFSYTEQNMIATLVRNHRRKFTLSVYSDFDAETQLKLNQLGIILRLAVLLCRDRLDSDSLSRIQLKATAKHCEIIIPTTWEQEHPLTLQDFRNEIALLKASSVTIGLSSYDDAKS